MRAWQSSEIATMSNCESHTISVSVLKCLCESARTDPIYATRKAVLTAIIPLPQALAGLAHRQMGLKTLSDHFQELGADFGEEIERRASDAKLILETAAKHGVAIEMLWKPSSSSIQQVPQKEQGK